MIRKTLMWPTFCATFRPVAIVWPGGCGVMSAAPASKARTIGVVAVALDADHPRPVGADQAERLQLVERLGHADDAGPAAGRVDDHVGQLPASARPGGRRAGSAISRPSVFFPSVRQPGSWKVATLK